ncbi:UDP-N-acetylglucosamine 2-epimerase [Euzebyella saccharophila]|uniref:UDP-N-acetylglucosamine 2-epimerase n=1 Tax=Euzebyella saccharophila TaxID=679664 RepID=A0ABV8JN16_9FLAO|nr:UDP-N-acetylglucosamine 2-epimerase [Euzebyella saccharophila]
MYDASLYYTDKAVRPNDVVETESFVLSTIHRQENTDHKVKLTAVFEALAKIAQKQKVVLPLHPRTVNKLQDFNIVVNKNIQILEPLGYFEMIWLLMNCTCVITDSGGLQKEAFFFKKPCITVREETEWVELVKNGVNFFVGPNKKTIVNTYTDLRNIVFDFKENLYGMGDTAKKIINTLVDYK